MKFWPLQVKFSHIMTHYHFEKDLPDGHQAELEAIERLKVRFNIGAEDIERSAKKGYDIRIISSGMTFEVKNDLMAYKTGNLAIEYESRGKPTGLAASLADYWIYKFSDVLWIVSTKQLRKKLFIEERYIKRVIGGDAGSQTKMYLVKVPVFKSWGKEL